MRLNTFDAATMAEAMRQIRSELGEDAVIISSRSGRGGRGVRIVAAVDGADPDETAFDGWISEQPGTGPEGEVSRALAYHGVPAALVRRLDGAAMVLAQQDATAALTAALDGSLGFQPLQDRLSPRPLMLVGPPGVGKTTVAAKLIVDAHRRGRKIVAVSCDLLRAGGIDQLRAFTRILGVRLATAKTPQALAHIVGAANGSDIVIDTAGANPHSAPDMCALAALVDAARAEPLLVLAAGADAMEAGDLATGFAGIGCRRIVATRLDAARRLGALLSAADSGRLAFAGATAEAEVAEAVSPLSPLSLARLLLSTTPRHVPLLEPEEALR